MGDDMDWDIIDDIIMEINKAFGLLQEIPKPNDYKIGGTYYGSTQLFSSVGNHLELIEDEPYTSYNHYGSTNYNHLFGIRIGGAYKEKITEKLMDYIKEHKQEVFDAGWCIVNDYGTKFSVYGIAKR